MKLGQVSTFESESVSLLGGQTIDGETSSRQHQKRLIMTNENSLSSDSKAHAGDERRYCHEAVGTTSSSTKHAYKYEKKKKVPEKDLYQQ